MNRANRAGSGTLWEMLFVLCCGIAALGSTLEMDTLAGAASLVLAALGFRVVGDELSLRLRPDTSRLQDLLIQASFPFVFAVFALSKFTRAGWLPGGTTAIKVYSALMALGVFVFVLLYWLNRDPRPYGERQADDS